MRIHLLSDKAHNFERGIPDLPDHPIVKKLFATKSYPLSILSDQLKEFISKRSYFIYPRTLYITLGDTFKSEYDPAADDFYALFQFLDALLNDRHGFSSIIIDLRRSFQFTDLFYQSIKTIKHKHKDSIYIISDQNFFDKDKSDSIDKYRSIGEALSDLRQSNKLKKACIVFPENLKFEEIEHFISNNIRLNSNAFKSSDIAVLDFSNVLIIEFFSICILNSLIHSIAHKYGMLSEIILPTATDVRSFLLKSRLLTVNIMFLSNFSDFQNELISLYKDTPKAPEKSALRPTLISYNADLIENAKDHVQFFIEILTTNYGKYFFFEHDLRYSIDGAKADKAILLNQLKMLICELAENAARYAKGVSYIGFYLDTKNNCFYSYIGDMGIGLKRGIKNNYKDSISSHNDALLACFNLKHRIRRKNERYYPGSGYGLKFVKSATARLKATLSMRTGDAYLRYMVNGSLTNLQPEAVLMLEGTHYFVSIPLKRADL